MTEWGTVVERGNSVGERKTPKRVCPGPSCDWNHMELPRVPHRTRKPNTGHPSLQIPNARCLVHLWTTCGAWCLLAICCPLYHHPLLLAALPIATSPFISDHPIATSCRISFSLAITLLPLLSCPLCHHPSPSITLLLPVFGPVFVGDRPIIID